MGDDVQDGCDWTRIPNFEMKLSRHVITALHSLSTSWLHSINIAGLNPQFESTAFPTSIQQRHASCEIWF
jgi:hypothetical protein